VILSALAVAVWVDRLHHNEHDTIRREWDQEIRGYQEIRKAWNIEFAAQEMIRVGWENECREMIAMREQLARDKEEWAKERKGETHIQGAKETPTWDNLQPAQQCLRYGMREYTAQIINVPADSDAMETCNATVAELHGRKICHPHSCEDKECNGVFGHWIVDYSEPECETTHFDVFLDKGCDWPRGRRIESKLEGVQPGDNLLSMCLSTPADFFDLHFIGPTACRQSSWSSPMLGSWWFYDPECDHPNSKDDEADDVLTAQALAARPFDIKTVEPQPGTK